METETFPAAFFYASKIYVDSGDNAVTSTETSSTAQQIRAKKCYYFL